MNFCLSANIIALFLFGNQAPDVRKASETMSIEGEWHPVGLEIEGDKQGAEAFRTVTFVFKDNQVTIHRGQTQTLKSTFKLDGMKSPKAIDIVPEYGVFKGRQIAGIYSLQDGELKICIIERDDRGRDIKDRPKEFKTKEKDGLMFVTLKRLPSK